MQEEERKEHAEPLDRGNVSIYTSINKTFLNQIKNVDLDGSFGTKIDTLARHVLWIRGKDPGAKCIVFSQYKDFLDVLGTAFGHFRIGFTSIEKKGGVEKFQKDPNVRIRHGSVIRLDG